MWTATLLHRTQPSYQACRHEGYRPGSVWLWAICRDRPRIFQPGLEGEYPAQWGPKIKKLLWFDLASARDDGIDGQVLDPVRLAFWPIDSPNPSVMRRTQSHYTTKIANVYPPNSPDLQGFLRKSLSSLVPFDFSDYLR